MRALKLIAPAAFALLVAAPALAGDLGPHLTVSGLGEVRAAPDLAMINTGVVTQSATAREALDANTEAMDALIESLREAGIASRDLQTSEFSVTPQYVYSDQRDDSGYTRPPQIVGYQVSNTVTITVRDLDDLGAVLDRAVDVGSNTIHGIQFGVADSAELLTEARRQAVAEAIAKAETYADAAGVELGAILKISERNDYMPPQPMMRAMPQAMAAESAVPVEIGEMTFSVNAEMTWALEQ